MGVEEIYNWLKVDDTLYTAGQPSAGELRALAAAGFVTVINLATLDPERAPAGEAGLVRALGMAYHHIPVAWDAPQASDYAAFERLLLRLPPGKTLIHCAANYRATAFYALYAQKQLGWDAAQAEAFRAQIWAGSDYPVWEAFMREMGGRGG